MHFVLYSPTFPLWRNTIGIVAGIFIIPAVVVFKLILMPFEKPVKRSANEVADYLRSFINDTAGEWDFDDFISCEIEDPALENLRRRAMEIQLPIEGDDFDIWMTLLREAEALEIKERVNVCS